MIDNKIFNVNGLFDILENKYKLKEIALCELCEYFSYYGENVSLFEVSEGLLQNGDTVKIYVGNALSGNAFLSEDERKYDLYILKHGNDRLLDCFYSSELGENNFKEITALINSFRAKSNN